MVTELQSETQKLLLVLTVGTLLSSVHFWSCTGADGMPVAGAAGREAGSSGAWAGGKTGGSGGQTTGGGVTGGGGTLGNGGKQQAGMGGALGGSLSGGGPSTSGGKPIVTGGSGVGGAAGAAGAPGGQEGLPTFVAVGYAGRRIRSMDLGKTWVDDQKLGGGGDDPYLLRGVVYAKGIFVAVGHRILTAPDGAHWTEQKNPGTEWLGTVRFGNGRFIAAGGYTLSAYSDDGLNWTKGGVVGQEEASRSMAFGANKFTVATSQGNWWESENGLSWKLLSSGHERNNETQLAYCDGDFKLSKDCKNLEYTTRRRSFGSGVWVKVDTGAIERSEDGKTWKTVLSGGNALDDVTFGYSPR